jgi:hypothetical protein
VSRKRSATTIDEASPALLAMRRERLLDALTDTLVRLRLRQIAGGKGLALFTGQSAHAPGPEGPEGEVNGQ